MSRQRERHGGKVVYIGDDERTVAVGISQEECARRLGITRERVGQIERRAMEKIRALISQEWKDTQL